MSYNKTVAAILQETAVQTFATSLQGRQPHPQQTFYRSVWVIPLRFRFVDCKQLVDCVVLGDEGTVLCITTPLVAAVYLITDGSFKAAITKMIHTFLLQQKKEGEKICVPDCYLYKHMSLKLSNISSIGSDYRTNCEISRNQHVQTLRSHIL